MVRLPPRMGQVLTFLPNWTPIPCSIPNLVMSLCFQVGWDYPQLPEGGSWWSQVNLNDCVPLTSNTLSLMQFWPKTNEGNLMEGSEKDYFLLKKRQLGFFIWHFCVFVRDLWQWLLSYNHKLIIWGQASRFAVRMVKRKSGEKLSDILMMSLTWKPSYPRAFCHVT